MSVPAARMDANYDVIRLDAGERIVTGISIPTRAYRGATVQVTCQWTGTIATAEVFGPPVKNPVYSANSVTFSWVPGPVNYNASFYYSGMSSEDPLRNLDCRESDADPAATFDPVFLANVRNYSVVRFLNWTTAVNDNRAVTWATRNRPGSGAFDAADGVALEYMILLANQAHVNPWFNVPWNADAAYVRKMAELVRDTLDPTLKAYVEVSNEVWNWGFKVTTQANKEGLEEGLAKDGNLAIMYRLAEKTGEVMDVWSSVFAGQMNRVVRVVSFQNGPSAVPYVLGFKDTARKVDAYATAPYFSTSTLTPDSLSTAAAMDAFFATTVPARIDETLTYAALTKAEVAKYGLRYISYEGGQHFLSSDLDLLKAIERDPRMGQAYTRYLTAWRDQIGDLLTLYQDVGVISIYGAWGLQEYPGQPLSEAPKAAAVERFRAGATGA
ncbi:hypothetical protein [Sphingobium nicotianae]|uniref:hypothetical protein n=1 Tax=Sphingobium nicotianae TaxID=2782607 RepID=UPI001BE49CA4|nr:hypothetical protein [Sphingobium nicotianae]